MKIDVAALWDYNQPQVSRERFRASLADASPEDTLILETQIARTFGLEKDFPQARQILTDLAPQLPDASAEAQTRYFLEWGRTFASATHDPATQSPASIAEARAAFLRAYDLARENALDGLAIDALHMLTFTDTALAQQVAWNRQAIALMEASSQPDAKKWAGPLYHNTGYALYVEGNYDGALAEFRCALAAREREGNAEKIRIAYWMIAWTLRAMGQLREALEIQLRLERECDAAGAPDPYVYEELALLYQALGDRAQAAHYTASSAIRLPKDL